MQIRNLRHSRSPVNVNGSLSTRQEEEITRLVPTELVHFKLELFVTSRLRLLDVNKHDEILFVAYCDGLAVRVPRHVDVFT